MPVRCLCTVVITALIAVQAEPVLAAFGYGITSTTGVTPGLPPTGPNMVVPGAHQNNTPIIFPEIIAGVGQLTANMDVDHDGSPVVATPTISGNVVNSALLRATLPMGTLFHSYMFHFDPVGSPLFKKYISNITFDNPIIGVQLFSSGFTLQKQSLSFPFPLVGYPGTLEEGDEQIALSGGPPESYYPGSVNYPPGGLASRGLEEDAFVLAISGNTITIGGSASGIEIDQIRIFTAAPEAASALTWAIISGMGYCGAFLRRRR